MNEEGGKMKTTENIRQEAMEELARIDRLQEMQLNEQEETEEYYNEYREPLSVDTLIEKNILLSRGGPSDGFKMYFNKGGELVMACYWVADWGAYEETWLDDDEAEKVFDFYLGGYIE